jgi:hypothetical protein
MIRFFVLITMMLTFKGYTMENQTIDINRENQLIAEVPTGAVFEHYSGKKYKILGVGRHSESLGLCVIYQGLYDCPTFGANPVWIRPLEMFLETVVINGKEQPRFRLLTGDSR